MNVNKKINFSTILNRIEYVFAIIIIIGVCIYVFNSLIYFFYLDWSTSEAFVLFLQRIFYMIIGIELARLLISYNIDTVVELLVFILARKLLLIDDDANPWIIPLNIISIILLFAAKFYFFDKDKK